VKVGDLVRIRQGMRYGKLALITVLKANPRAGVGHHTVEVVVEGISHGYYKRDLEVISEGR
jgi:hypothetical protein